MFTEQSINKLFDQRINQTKGETVSLCHTCYKHVPALRYEKDGAVWLMKSCHEHGVSHHLLERDAEFYDNLEYSYTPLTYFDKVIMIDVTDRCNISCPHCYHIPNNKKKDKSIDLIVNDIKNYPKNFDKIVLVGAEPTMRRDLSDLIMSIKSLGLSVSMLSNGIRFSDMNMTNKVKDANLISVGFGLNHPSYLNNNAVRQKQLQGILNIESVGIKSAYIGYTMSSLVELDFIMNEIITMPWDPYYFRIRYGSDIGRYPDQERLYVSDLVKQIQKWCEVNDKSFKIVPGDNNIYHTMVEADERLIRVIQWCNPEDIDMEELKTGPWCDFSGEPITNFLHQIIRRDFKINQNKELPDIIPERYMLKNCPIKTPLDFKDFIS